MKKKCIFCDLAKRKNKIIYSNRNFFSIFDAAPQVKGHSLVISKKHFKTILDIPNDLALDFLDAIKKTYLILMEELNSDGFNLIVNTGKSAGQIVNHVHIHILPRKKRDGYSISIKKSNVFK